MALYVPSVESYKFRRYSDLWLLHELKVRRMNGHDL